MDVGFYLGELLMQQGEVSVPGLGYFVQVRVSGYYNDEERKFYPPYHQAQFDVQSIDDDALAEYIANKKNISVASARYFAEKYITNLKQEALIAEVPIGNLGWFYTEFTQLTFRPADKIIDDTIFYGFEPVSISKVGDIKPAEERPKVQLNYPPRLSQPTVVTETPKPAEPVTAEPEMATYETSVSTSPVAEDIETLQQPVSSYQSDPGISPEFFEPGEDEEEEENKGPLKLILAILIVIVMIGVAVFALYRYQPDTFARIAFWKKKVVVTDTIKPKEIMPAIAADTTIFLDSVQADTSAGKGIDTIVNTPASAKKAGVITQAAGTKLAVANKTTTVTPPKTAPVTKAPVATQPTAITKTAIVSPPKQAASISTVPIKTAAAPAAKTASTRVRSSDATGTRRFEVYVTPASKNMAEANQLITKLKKNGLDPRLVTDAAGPLIHVSIGHFKTVQEAKAFAIKAQESGKVTGDAYPNEIIPSARRFEVYVTPTCKDMAEANRLMSKLRKNGLNPYIVTDAPGSLIQVSIGQFKTAEEAKAFAVKAQETGKVTGSAYPNEIIPQ